MGHRHPRDKLGVETFVVDCFLSVPVIVAFIVAVIVAV
jgi:hypothetical protein